MNAEGIRRTIYLSPIKDNDIIKYVNPNNARYTFSSIIKELVRDGIKFRLKSNHQQENVIQSNTLDLNNIVLTKKEISDEDLESRLDSKF